MCIVIFGTMMTGCNSPDTPSHNTTQTPTSGSVIIASGTQNPIPSTKKPTNAEWAIIMSGYTASECGLEK